MVRAEGSRTTLRLKIVVLFLFLAAVVWFQTGLVGSEIRGEAKETPVVVASSEPMTAEELVDGFDKMIQKRFLTMPMFGISRLQPLRPTGPQSTHLSSFSPHTEEEFSAVAAFDSGGWDVGLYLFGRRVQLRMDTKKEGDYNITYRMFNPIPVTKGLKRSDFRSSKKFADEIKNAFVEFQRPESENYNQIKFDIDKWTYIARPVRAVNQSCLECHKDYVITERLGDGKFTVRDRRIGDPNGVLIYALSKRDE